MKAHIQAHLDELEVEYWFDEDLPKTIGSEDDWWNEIARQISNRPNFIFLYTDAWQVSDICRREFDLATKAGRTVIPVQYEEFEAKMESSFIPSRYNIHKVYEDGGKDGLVARLTSVSKTAVDQHKISKRQLSARNTFVDKINMVKNGSVLLVGPSYVDVILHPVTTTILENDKEHSTLQEPKLLLGGSTSFVGRYLFDCFNIKSHVITNGVRKGNLFADTFETMFSKESWVDQRHPIGDNETPPVTFALQQLSNAAKTMFTYKADDASFSWKPVAKAIDTISGPKILHLSGFVKTNLRSNLPENLHRLKNETLIILDHGRFSPTNKEVDCQESIKYALTRELVDIHIATLSDFIALYDIEINLSEASPAEILTTLRESDAVNSTAFTVLRDHDYEESRTTYYIDPFDIEQVSNDEVIDEEYDPKGFAYTANKLNASLIGSLISPNYENKVKIEDLRSIIRSAIEQQLAIK